MLGFVEFTMRRFLHFGRYALLVVITIAAGVGMVILTMKTSAPRKQEYRPAKLATAVVAVLPVQPEEVEIYDVYSGLIEPKETYQLAFEIAGRIASLGTEQTGYNLDVGDRITAGEVVARLDTTALEARKREAQARLELAQSMLRRAEQLREMNISALAPEEYERRVNEVALAESALDLANKALSDATLRAPATGVIASRLALVGETVNAQQPIFELVQTDDVLLGLYVPETRIRELEHRMEEVQAHRREHPQPEPGCRNCRFKAYVEMVGKDRFGNPWPTQVGQVHQIGERAEPNGMFRVEVLLANQDGTLKPGNVARARVVTTTLSDAYRVPLSSVIFREGEAILYVTETRPQPADAPFREADGPFPEVEQEPVPRAPKPKIK